LNPVGWNSLAERIERTERI